MKQLPVEITLLLQTSGVAKRQPATAATAAAAGPAGEKTGGQGKSPRSTPTAVSSRSSFSHKLKKEMEKISVPESAKRATESPNGLSDKSPALLLSTADAAGKDAAEALCADADASGGRIAGEARTPQFAGGKGAVAGPRNENSAIEKGDAAAPCGRETKTSAELQSVPPEDRLPPLADVPQKNFKAAEKTAVPVPFAFAAAQQAQAGSPDAAAVPKDIEEPRPQLSAVVETGAKAAGDKVAPAETGRIFAAASPAGRRTEGLPGGSTAEKAALPGEKPTAASETENLTAARKTPAAGVAAVMPEKTAATAPFEESSRMIGGPKEAASGVQTVKTRSGREIPAQTVERGIGKVPAGGASSQEISALVRKLSGEGDRRPARAVEEDRGSRSSDAAAGKVPAGRNQAASMEPAVLDRGQVAAAAGNPWTVFVERVDDSVRKAESFGTETERRAKDVFGGAGGRAESSAPAAADARSVGPLSALAPPSALDQAPRLELQNTMARIAEEGRRLVVDEGGGQVRMSLDPPELGSLDMDVKVRNSSVQILLTAEDRNVQQLLQSQRDVLERALAESGLRVESFDVVLSSSADGGSSSSERWQTRQESQAGRMTPAGVEEPDAGRTPSARMIRDEAVGNGISLFV